MPRPVSPDGRPVTLADVARAAGVHASTVSRVLNQPGRGWGYGRTERVLDLLADAGPGRRAAPDDPEVLPVELVVRDSTGPPRP